jgi:hypothetical protein
MGDIDVTDERTTSTRYTGPERRVRFDHRLLLAVLACVYLPLLVVLAWHFVERTA